MLDRPRCPVCGAQGPMHFGQARDVHFGAPGIWHMRQCSDAACRTCWLDPVAAPGSLSELYRTYHTHRSTEHVGVLRALYSQAMRGVLADRLGYPGPGPLGALLGRCLSLDPERVEQILHSVGYLRHRPNGRVLDVGCGEGARLDRLRSLGWQCVGVDFDEAAIAAGRGRGLDLRTGTVEALAEPDASFDAVTLSHVIEHVPDPLSTLTACRRLLRRDGVLWIATPNAVSDGARAWGAAWRGWEVPRHLQVFTGPSLAASVSRAGFGAVSWRTSARIARTIHLESAAPGLVRAGGPYPRELHRAASRFAATERAHLREEPTAGEEILLEARL